MDTLEYQVREALIGKRTGEIYALMQQPQFRENLRGMLTELTDSLIGGMRATSPVKTKRFEDERLDQLPDQGAAVAIGIISSGLQEMQLNMLKQYMDQQTERMVSDPEQIKKLAYETAKNNYTTRMELEIKLAQVVTTITQELGEGTAASLATANKAVLKFSDYQDQIVNGLVEIAKEKSIAQALTDEAESAVTIRLFPTKAEYVDFWNEGLEAGKAYVDVVKTALGTSKEDKDALMVGNLLGTMQKIIEKQQELANNTYMQSVKERADRIYGA